MIMQITLAFVATLCFAIMFNVPRSELVLAGLVGAWGWLFYQIAHVYNHSQVTCTFVAAIAVAAISRVLAIGRKMPITLFLISGIIPLVPGSKVYGTMYHTIANELVQATAQGIDAFKISGVISIAIIIVLSLPPKMFALSLRKKI